MKFTVITPSYNQADYLEQTIKSVVSQEGDFQLQYLIYDGGSTDGSVEIIKKYAEKFPHLITWQSQKDEGQVDALNQGLRQADGDVVAYLNSDDYLLPNALKKVAYRFAYKTDRPWIVGNCKIKARKLKWTFKIKHIWPIDKARFFLKIFNTINQPAVFIKKELVDKVGEFDQSLNYAFDYDYWLRCLEVSLPDRFKDKLAVFRVHSQSKGSKEFNQQFKEDLQVLSRYNYNPLLTAIHWLLMQITVLIYKLYK